MCVSFPASTFYRRWHQAAGGDALFREGQKQTPPERLLQAVWHHQRLLRDQLRTLDGTPVRVLHPGFWNRESGPDFRGAVVQFGSEPPRAGDIEIDLEATNWHAHRHDRNPAFTNVVLYVTWNADTKTSLNFPVLALHASLDAPLS
jgi:hypothetical protein